MKFLKYTISLSIAITSFSAAAATNADVVSMVNATSCHVTSDGKHAIGNESSVGTFSQDGSQYSSIAPDSSGKVPLLKKSGGQYIMIDNDMAADRFAFDYTGEKYILSYDNPTYCKHKDFPPCLTISKVNPCG